jgi:cysteine synthase A
MRALGAELEEVPSDVGQITKELIEAMIDRAYQLSDEAGTFYSDQLQNKDAVAGYHPLGEEIWSQTEGQLDAFVHVAGTAHSITGTSTVLRNHKPDIRIIAVEPVESPV